MTDQTQSMDRLHRVMASIRRETKSAKDPSKVFREFLSHLDQANSAVPRRARTKPMPRRPAKKRAK